MMLKSVQNPTQLPLNQVIDHILTYGKITRLDEKRLMQAALGREDVNSQELTRLNQVFDRLRMGLVSVVD
ncbi:MAG: hypothetical protein F6K19_42395 [Cyanothece sp. SIO1E1]|nr:hypothetical protein [Cyanothece sp. SIO1E1]